MYDILIIGAGPGGYEVAVDAARAGLQVGIIEARALGGTCLNEGCIPTKCLCRTAETLALSEELGRRSEECTQSDKNSLTEPNGTPHSSLLTPHFLKDALARKNQVVQTLQQGIAQLMRTPGITLLQGTARFLEPHRVEVQPAEGETYAVEAKNILIATGSEPASLPISGADLKTVLTSTEMLQLESVPARLCIIGGGVIGMEFASIFRAFGSEVSVIEYCKEILPPFDRDIAKRLRVALKKRGISFNLGAAATRIECTNGGSTVVYFEEKGKEKSIEADVVLMAVGRRARYAALGLEAVGIACERRGIVVDENYETSQPGVYAVGDVNGLCQLAHAATAQSRAVLEHILTGKPARALGAIPAAVFTAPEAAMVGATEEALTESGTPYEVHRALYRSCGKALAMGEEEGMVKLLTDAEGHLLGAHLLGAHASDLVHEAALLIHLNGTLDDLRHTVHAHPTLSELFVNVN